MGICLYAQTLCDEKIEAILASPPLVWRIIAPEDRDCYLDAIGMAKPPGLLARWLGKAKERPPEVPDFEFSEHELSDLDMDKSWDGVNYCLKQLIPAGDCPNFFEGGRPVGNIEVGYGPALCVTSADMAKIAKRYCDISETALLSQYAPSRMKGVYPEALWRRNDDDCREYLTENFALLKAFLKAAASHRLGAIVQYT